MSILLFFVILCFGCSGRVNNQFEYINREWSGEITENAIPNCASTIMSKYGFYSRVCQYYMLLENLEMDSFGCYSLDNPYVAIKDNKIVAYCNAPEYGSLSYADFLDKYDGITKNKYDSWYETEDGTNVITWITDNGILEVYVYSSNRKLYKTLIEDNYDNFNVVQYYEYTKYFNPRQDLEKSSNPTHLDDYLESSNFPNYKVGLQGFIKSKNTYLDVYYLIYGNDDWAVSTNLYVEIGEPHRIYCGDSQYDMKLVWGSAQQDLSENDINNGNTVDNTIVNEYFPLPNEVKLGIYYSEDGKSTLTLSENENKKILHFELSLYRIGAWGGSIFLTKQNEFSFSAKSHQNDMEIVEGIISFNRDKIIFNVVKGDSLLAPGGRSFVYVDTNDSIDNLNTVTTDTFLDYADGYWGRKNTTGGWDILCFENGKMCDYTYAGAIWMWDGTVEEIEMISDNTFDVKISYQEIVYGDEDEIADSYKVTYTFKIEGGPKKILIIPDANIEYVYTYVGKTQEALETFVKIND